MASYAQDRWRCEDTVRANVLSYGADAVHVSARPLVWGIRVVLGGVGAVLATPQVAAWSGNPNEIQSSLGLKNEPVFGEAIKNVTVAAGREATLSCIVDSLGDFKVGWLKVDSQTILSLQKRVVTHNTRISVTHDEHRTWNLHIKQVKESDRGCYMCQINTPVMKNGVGCIEVHVPPDIMNDAHPRTRRTRREKRVQLRCEARGYPPPEILWKREDGKNIILKSSGRDGTR
ncbi:hypothetical protein C7M84_012562, partial [Penaeus vannamei]